MADSTIMLVAPSAAVTTSGATGGFRMHAGDAVAILIAVTAVSGVSASAVFTVEWSHDGVTFAQGDPADTFVAVTAAGSKVARFARKGPVFRLAWTLAVTTTPSFTFSATAVYPGAGSAY